MDDGFDRNKYNDMLKKVLTDVDKGVVEDDDEDLSQEDKEIEVEEVRGTMMMGIDFYCDPNA